MAYLYAMAALVFVFIVIISNGTTTVSIAEVFTSLVNSIYQSITATKTKIPNKLKDGDKVKTPESHPDEFIKNSDGSYTHRKTKWVFKKDTFHKDHWDVSPKNGKTGNYHNVSFDGRIL